MALSCKRADFTQVISLFDEMVALLQQEQTHDEIETVCCESSVEIAQDKSKSLTMDSKSLQSALSDSNVPFTRCQPAHDGSGQEHRRVRRRRNDIHESPSG